MKSKFFWLCFIVVVALLSGYFTAVHHDAILCRLEIMPFAWRYGLFVALYVGGTFIADLKDPLRLVGAILFGALLSSGLIYAAELINLLLLFSLSRYLGLGYVQAKVPLRYQKLYDKLECLTFGQILVLRLLPFISYRVLDLGFGLTKISLRRYFYAAVLGSWPRILWIQLPLAAVGSFSVNQTADYFLRNKFIFAAYILYTLVVCVAAIRMYVKIKK